MMDKLESGAAFTVIAIATGVILNLGYRYYVKKDKQSLIKSKLSKMEIFYLVAFLLYAIWYYLVKH